LSDGRRHNKVPVAVRPAAGADAAVEHGMSEECETCAATPLVYTQSGMQVRALMCDACEIDEAGNLGIKRQAFRVLYFLGQTTDAPSVESAVRYWRNGRGGQRDWHEYIKSLMTDLN
jgi:hypothetical protein